MLQWLLMHRALAGAAAVVVSLALAAGGGYKYRDAVCDADAATARAAVSDAMATLAQQYAAADAEAATARSAADALRRARIRENLSASENLPDRDCGWSDDDSRLLDDTYCTVFPSAPGCVHD